MDHEDMSGSRGNIYAAQYTSVAQQENAPNTQAAGSQPLPPSYSEASGEQVNFVVQLDPDNNTTTTVTTRTIMPDIESGCNPRNPCCLVRIACGFFVVILSIIIACIADSYHKINEGNVGIYFKYGALMDRVTLPGVHFMQPFVSDYEEIKIRPHTDTLDPIVSVTKDGIQNTFKDIQIITRIKMDKLIPMAKQYGLEFKDALVFDRIKEELRIYCANHTIDEVYNTKFLEIVTKVKENVITSIDRLANEGIEILNLVIPKPDIPQDIAHNYKQVKVQWTEQLVATQQQKTETIKKETESIKAIADAKRNKAVLEIKIKERVLDKEGDEKISTINNEIVKKKEENLANIEKYKIEKQAEANKALYTQEYVQLQMARSLSNNTKLYFSGENSVMGGLLNKFLGNQG